MKKLSLNKTTVKQLNVRVKSSVKAGMRNERPSDKCLSVFYCP
jgi:hypothetical protein